MYIKRCNKLIAVFMGAKIRGGGKLFQFPNGDKYFNTVNKHMKELKYHSSWDQLMPVVQKIVPPKGCVVRLIHHQMDVIDSLHSAKIEKVYESVVAFIEKYNEKEIKDSEKTYQKV